MNYLLDRSIDQVCVLVGPERGGGSEETVNLIRG